MKAGEIVEARARAEANDYQKARDRARKATAEKQTSCPGAMESDRHVAAVPDRSDDTQ